MLGRLGRWFDDRVGASRFARSVLNKVFPDHWSFMLGEVALYAFVVLLVTGIFLTFFFDPSAKEVVYHGSYRPLQGVRMTQAYASTVHLSLDVRAGLAVRQIHHWAALVFLGAIVVHLSRVFFTGAFRRPRELNWLVGVTLLVLAILNGFAGYSLPDDLLSGTGLRIAYSVVLSIPVLGSWLAFLVFGGEFPADALISRLYVVHILLVPALIIGLLTVHLSVLWRQKHTQFPGRGRREDNVVGSRLWPTYAARSIGLFAFVAAVLCLLGGLAQINPVWLYGPYSPSAVSTAAQPDWYMGWLEGALRVMPAFRLTIFGYRVPEILVPAVILPGITFLLLYLWPFLEARVTGEGRVDHHLLDRPRDRPVRTALGAATLAFYIVLLFAGGQDIFADKLDVSIRYVTLTLRIALLVVPPLVGWFAWKLSRDLARGEPLAVYATEGEAPVGPADVHEPTAGAGGDNPPPVAGRIESRGRMGGVVAGVAGAGAAIGGFVLGRRSKKADVTVLEVRGPRRQRK